MGVLLLNASYEAIRVVSLKRAVVLVLQEKAEILESSGPDFCSENVAIPRPEVIRLKYYVKIPFKSKVPLSNRAVLNRDKYRCAYCSKKANTVDHVLPKAKGGKHEWTNVVAACGGCNSKKADKKLGDGPGELNWKLNVVPTVPTAKTWIVVGTPERADAWSEWLENS